MRDTIDIGFVTQLGMDYHDAFEHAKRLGYDYVEIMLDGPTSVDRLTADEDAGLLQAELDREGFVVHLPFKLDIASPHEHVRDGAIDELKHCIAAAESIGANKAVVHASSESWAPAWEREDIIPILIESINELDIHARTHGVQLCAENIPGGFFDTYDFEFLFEETDVLMTFDTAHAAIDGMDGAEMAAFIETWADRIGHIHLSDMRDGMGDEHLPFGAGDIEFDQIIRALRTTGWTGTMSLEVYTTDWEYLSISHDRLLELL